MKLRHPNTEPPGGWIYLEERTGYWMGPNDSLFELAQVVAEYRKYQKLGPVDIPSVEAQIGEQLCSRLGPEFCHVSPGEFWSNAGVGLTMSRIIDFSATALAFIASGSKMVDKPEWQRRADICKKCPFNRNPPGCACTPFFKIMAGAVPSDKKDDGLRVCLVCGCGLAVKTLIPNEILDKAESPAIFPAHCWRHS